MDTAIEMARVPAHEKRCLVEASAAGECECPLPAGDGGRTPGETLHRERSGLTTTCRCLFGFVYKKKPTYLERFIREESSQRAPPFFVDGGSIN